MVWCIGSETMCAMDYIEKQIVITENLFYLPYLLIEVIKFKL